MHHDIAKFFQLKGYLVYGLEMKKKCLEIRVRSANVTERCPVCNTVCRKVHQEHERRVLHLKVDKNKVILLMTKRRFKCKCGKVFTEVPPGMKRYGRRTMFQHDQVLKDLVSLGFMQTGKRNGISATTARNDLLRAPLERGILWPKRGDIRLGIDGHSHRGNKMALTVVELKHGRPLTVLPNDYKSTVKHFLSRIPENIKPRITEVCMDMNTGYANAVREELPGASIVCDHFHVIQAANNLIDDVRKALQDPRYRIPRKIWLKNKEKLSHREFEKLVSFGEVYPKLFELWKLKEDLRMVYEMHNKKVAAHRLKKVIEDYEKIESGYTQAFAKTLKKWRKEILNFFDHRTTNASVESRHQKFKLTQRIAYGFRNIDSYIAKITLTFVPLYLILDHTI